MVTARKRGTPRSGRTSETRSCKTISKIRNMSTRSHAVQRSRASKNVDIPVTNPGTNATIENPSEELIQGTIPDVLRWARQKIDAETQFHEGTAGLSGARSLARQILARHNVIIVVNDIEHWKAETRLWENIYALSVKLPGEGKAGNIFDAMSRYPSSVLVYRGLKSFFGRYMVIAGKRTPRFTLRQNALAFFSPYGSEDSLAKKWFDGNTLPRMQEMVVHMCGVSEYILRCAYMCKDPCVLKEHEENTFIRLMECRLRGERDFKNREVLRFEPWNSLSELPAEHLSTCLEKSVNVAHCSVIEGARTASRKYGQRESSGKDRRRIQLWMLRRPLSDIMDALVRGLEAIVSEVLGNSVDIDEFRLRATRLLRRAETIYQDVGNTWFNGEVDFKVPAQLPKGTEALVSPTHYTFTFTR